jgi:hypothetical protein
VVVSPPGHDPSLRAAFRRRCPSTTSPSLRASTGILNPKLVDRRAHAIDGSVIFSGIARIEDQAVNRPDLNLEGLCCRVLRKHASPFDTSKWRCLSEGALCAGLSNRVPNYNSVRKCFRCLSACCAERQRLEQNCAYRRLSRMPRGAGAADNTTFYLRRRVAPGSAFSEPASSLLGAL